MEVNVAIDGDAVNDAVVKAIVDSVLGQKIRDELKRQATSYYQHDVVKNVLAELVRQYARELAHDEYGDVLKEKIRKQMNDDKFLDDVVSTMLNKDRF